MKKILSISLAFILLAMSLLPIYAVELTPPTTVSAQGIYMVELGKDLGNDTDDKVLYQNNYTQKFSPSYFAQLMTAILVLEKYTEAELKSEVYSLAPQTKTSVTYNGNPTAGIKDKETLSLYDLLYLMLLNNGCDAALMLAEKYSNGDIEKFVSQMNIRARQLGAASTNFTNPTGINDAEQATTIANLATLSTYALFYMKNKELFKKIISSAEYSLPKTNVGEARTIKNSNLFVREYEGCSGVLSWSSSESGGCFISMVSKNNFNILSIVIKSQNAFTDTKTLYEWAFDSFAVLDISKSDTPLLTSYVTKTDGAKTITLYTDSKIEKLIPKSQLAEIQIVPRKNLSSVSAPIHKNQVLGFADIKLGDEILATVGIVAKEEIKKSNLFIILDIAVVLAPIILVVLAIIIFNFIRRKRRQRRRMRSWN
jgi:D-alanyl-D-alanine carboxypeptidase (penicillin-binding protein 5/6)